MTQFGKPLRKLNGECKLFDRKIAWDILMDINWRFPHSFNVYLQYYDLVTSSTPPALLHSEQQRAAPGLLFPGKQPGDGRTAALGRALKHLPTPQREKHTVRFYKPIAAFCDYTTVFLRRKEDV